MVGLKFEQGRLLGVAGRAFVFWVDVARNMVRRIEVMPMFSLAWFA